MSEALAEARMSSREQTDSVPLGNGGGFPSKQKQEQVLVINPPQELVFTGPFREPVSSVMTLTNPSDKKVRFKIKTTAPQQYSVKPNLGIVYPNETVKIAVNLQPFDYDPEKKCRHKFMVQSMFASNRDTPNLEALWKDVDSSQLMDSKLRCLFVIPGSDVNGSGGAGSEANGRKEANPVSAASSIAGSDYQTVDANKAGDQPIPTAPPLFDLTAAPSKANAGESNDLKKSVEEIRRLQKEISQLQHDNVELKDEAFRAKRRAERTEGMISASSGSSITSDGYTVNAMNPDANALSVTYVYIALIILVVGIILGKVIF